MQHRPIRTILAAAAFTLTAPVALQAQYAPANNQAPGYDQTAQVAYNQPLQSTGSYDPAQLDQMLAPIALYPDQLLGQILMASTYPQEVQDAAAWLQDRNNASLRGEALTAALEQQDWDPSVKSLVPFPVVIRMLASHADWMQQLGDAFLADQAAVMDSVQRLRQQAWNKGTLRSGSKLVVTRRGSEIVIAPASPSVVYVPTYNPTVVYGEWRYPDNPPFAYEPEGYAYDGPGIGFGLSVFVPSREWGWDRFDWREHRIHIDRDRMSFWDRGRPDRVREDRAAGDFWVHNPEHRRGVDYGNPVLRERYANAAGQERNGQEQNARQQNGQRFNQQEQQQRNAQQLQERNQRQQNAQRPNAQEEQQQRNAQQLQDRNQRQQNAQRFNQQEQQQRNAQQLQERNQRQQNAQRLKEEEQQRNAQKLQERNQRQQNAQRPNPQEEQLRNAQKLQERNQRQQNAQRSNPQDEHQQRNAQQVQERNKRQENARVPQEEQQQHNVRQQQERNRPDQRGQGNPSAQPGPSASRQSAPTAPGAAHRPPARNAAGLRGEPAPQSQQRHAATQQANGPQHQATAPAKPQQHGEKPSPSKERDRNGG